jgi:hypothetical protein
LLHPVPAAFEQVRAGEPGKPRRLLVDGVGEPRGRGVKRAGDEDGRLCDRGAVEGGEVFPVAVDVAIAVQRAREPVALELNGVRVELGRGDPARKRRVECSAIEIAVCRRS